MRKIVILHVFDDEKFFDFTARFFDALNNISNKYYFYTPDVNYRFKRIKSINKIRIFNDYKDYCKQFSNKSIDIIYFHSLYVDKYKLFKHISKDKIVIWWCFGADIYYKVNCLRPLIDIELYKPLTKKYLDKEKRNISLIEQIKIVIKHLISFYYKRKQNKVINRIDYFSPVLAIEYILMKNNPYFKAKPFMINAAPGIYLPKPLEPVKSAKNILIGNSLTYTNNHLDLFETLNNLSIDFNRKYIIPISYGDAFKNNIFFLKLSFKAKNVIWLEDFIPQNEYMSYMDSITHAIFGHLRQQAIGNINFCLERGIKIYLYESSIIYKQLKESGYIVYSIDKDLTASSLNKCLSEEYATHNYELFCNSIKDRITSTEIELQEMIKN